MNILWNSSPIWHNKGLGIIRIILGLLLIYHGVEIFQTKLMQSYITWDAFKYPYGYIMVYTGKLAELISGISLFLGLFTRIGALLCIGTFTYITFMVGHGRFWYEDQHPFMFALFGLLYFFTGPGAWSLDGRVFKRKKNY